MARHRREGLSSCRELEPGYRVSFRAMKIGEWEGIGRSRALVAHQLGELHADEYAAHVTISENGRQRILVAADLGLFEFSWGPNTSDPDSIWYLRGGVTRWPSVKGHIRRHGEIGRAHV